MDKLKFIKEALEYDLAYWENAEKVEDDCMGQFYRGAVASLRSFTSKIEFIFKEEEKTRSGI